MRDRVKSSGIKILVLAIFLVLIFVGVVAVLANISDNQANNRNKAIPPTTTSPDRVKESTGSNNDITPSPTGTSNNPEGNNGQLSPSR